jgi:hypothetical protein
MAGLEDTLEVVRHFSYPWSQAFWNLKLVPEGAMVITSLIAHLTPSLGVEIDAPTPSKAYAYYWNLHHYKVSTPVCPLFICHV